MIVNCMFALCVTLTNPKCTSLHHAVQERKSRAVYENINAYYNNTENGQNSCAERLKTIDIKDLCIVLRLLQITKPRRSIDLSHRVLVLFSVCM